MDPAQIPPLGGGKGGGGEQGRGDEEKGRGEEMREGEVRGEEARGGEESRRGGGEERERKGGGEEREMRGREGGREEGGGRRERSLYTDVPGLHTTQKCAIREKPKLQKTLLKQAVIFYVRRTRQPLIPCNIWGLYTTLAHNNKWAEKPECIVYINIIMIIII